MKRPRIIILSIIVLIIFGAVLVVLDWHEVRQVIGQADWEMTFFALLFTALSYFFMSYSYFLVNRIFGIQIKPLDIFQIGYVSVTLNNLLAFLGAAGHSLRIMLMKQKGVDAEQTLAASIFHSHFHNLIMFCLLPVGIIYLIVHHSVTGSSVEGLGVTAGILLIFVVIGTSIVFSRTFRLAILSVINKLILLIIRKNIETSLASFDNSMRLGVAAILKRPIMIAPVLSLMIVDWSSSLAALWFCFYALGESLLLGVLIAGFAVGITVGNISMIPGGLGVQEASMAGVYSLLGVSFNVAALAAILFRVVMDFIPFLISLLFYRHLLQQSIGGLDARGKTG
jgi:uncharacterized protein (TIRG00374 family)